LYIDARKTEEDTIHATRGQTSKVQGGGGQRKTSQAVAYTTRVGVQCTGCKKKKQFVVSRLACTTVVHISISNDHTSHQRPHVLLGHGIVELMSRRCTKVCLLVCSPQELRKVEKRGRNPDRSSSFTAGAETLEVCSMQSVSITLRHHSRQVQSRWRCAACSLSAELYANPISMHNGASAACSPSFCLQGMGSKLLHVSTAKNTRGEAEGPA